MNPIHGLSRPKLAPKAKLRFDRREERFLLLYPERGLILNESASEVLDLCRGRLTVGTIVDLLADRHPETDRESIQADVLMLLADLRDRGLVRE